MPRFAVGHSASSFRMPGTVVARRLALIACVLNAGCTTVVEHGTYGPFRIGETKAEVLEQAKVLHLVLMPLPAKPTGVSIASSNTKDLAQLNWSNAIAVSLDNESRTSASKEGFTPPLEIEFTNDRISALWREERIGEHTHKDEELARLSATLEVGMSRVEAWIKRPPLALI